MEKRVLIVKLAIFVRYSQQATQLVFPAIPSNEEYFADFDATISSAAGGGVDFPVIHTMTRLAEW